MYHNEIYKTLFKVLGGSANTLQGVGCEKDGMADHPIHKGRTRVHVKQ